MLSENKDGFSSFVVDPKAVNPKGDIHFKCNRDSGKSYIASNPENLFYLDEIKPGNTLSITVSNMGFKSLVRLVPHETEGICYQGHYLPGKALSISGRTGDYVKLASLDARENEHGVKMWHVIESSGEWFKEGL